MLKGFRDFVFRGNLLDLAVAVVIGAAFGAVVTSLVENILTPLISAIVGAPDFSAFILGPFRIGLFLNSIVSFLLIAVALYFIVITPANRILAAMKKNEKPPSAPELSTQEKLLAEIRDELKRRPL